MGGLAGALQTHHHDDGRRLRADDELAVGLAHEADQLLVDDLDDLLAGKEAFHHFAADGAFGDGLHKVAHDLEVHVRFEQGELHFAHALAHVRLGEPAFVAEFAEGVVELFG